MVSKEETGRLQKVFIALDTNKDGFLSHEELLTGFTEMYGEIGAKEEVDRIYKAVDVDHSGEIDFSEFMAASVDKSALFTDAKLKAAYSSFDRDGCGHLKVGEIKEVLGVGKNISDKVWEDVLKEVDVNGDGEIEFDEFKIIMIGLLDPIPENRGPRPPR